MRVAFSCLLVALSLLASPPASIAQADEACDTPHSSQAELNDCFGNAYKKSDAQLNGLYKQITGRLKDDQATTKLLVTAQRAWVGFRDAECDFSTSAVSGGSAFGMVQAICLDRLTSKRIEDFKTYLKCQEGNLDCPVPAR
jgi:uncharacterized protein YecT (DUF1311 family)